ncbi:hypothetical protein FHW69_003801 [Luteibacter sp. Sphag1AF]|uniref:hypothetical protein n=1 Tax=Luteibacter sp. Sphag1AF TaxID=2587031 RepID=UPI00160DFA1C|nr:hypothetical protein [Luteibacter sp. Sphag1AF]MBB3229149.1 hypothetical protein [Luteibacter sp. Sphag1AF]
MTLQQIRRASHIGLAVLLCFLSLGCHTAMQNVHSSRVIAQQRQRKFPLTFTAHNFAAYCFSTSGCKVLYDGMYDVMDSENKLTAPLMGPKHLHGLDAVTLDIANFPPPAVVSWRSRDGTFHEDSVNLDEIFKDRRVVHNVDEKKISETVFIADPDILLIVDDRTLSVYMKTYLPLKELSDPANRYSGMSESFVLVYTKTY